MTARWLTLALIAALVGSTPSLTAQEKDPKAEESRGPGRFLRKLRDDFSGKKEEEPKEKESPRTAERTPSPKREDSFQPLFSPPAFLGGAVGKRGDQEQETAPTPNRPPFKFSQPTLPPPVSNSLPRPTAADSSRLPSPPTAQRGPATQRTTASRPTSSPQPGVSEAPGSNAVRSFELPTSPARKLPKPTLSQGFGFELADRDDGLVINSIKPKGNAEQAEMKKGDLITQIGGVPVEQVQQFEEIAEMLENGDQIELVIARRGKEQTVTLQFGQPPAADEPSLAGDSQDSQRLEDTGEPTGAAVNELGEIRDFAPPPSGSSRYEPGVSELPDRVANSSRQSANGFRAPWLPEDRPEAGGQYSQAELIGVIRQQQETIRQLQLQVQQLRLDQQRQQQLLQQQAQGKSRGKR